MKKNLLLSIAALAAVILSSSCEKDPIVIPNDRTPQRVDFTQRTLPANYIIGRDLPKEAEAVDLGLSVKWANMDLGSKAFDEPGNLYAWGMISIAQNFSWEYYEHNDYHSGVDSQRLFLTKYCFDQYGEMQDLAEGGVTLDKYDDVAYLRWGEGWRMPSKQEFAELIERCKWTVDNVKTPTGYDNVITVTGPNGKSIKISQNASLRMGFEKTTLTESSDVFKIGYWTSTLDTVTSESAVSANIEVDEDANDQLVVKKAMVDRLSRFVGLPIRPVYTE